LFEIFTAMTVGAKVQLCFAPSDEKGFFGALRQGLFDAKAVCSTVDAMQATATEQEDKVMITNRIAMEVGIEKYNKQLKLCLEEQYNLVALAGAHRGTSAEIAGGGWGGSEKANTRERLAGHEKAGEEDAETVHQQYAEALTRMRIMSSQMELLRQEIRGDAIRGDAIRGAIRGDATRGDVIIPARGQAGAREVSNEDQGVAIESKVGMEAARGKVGGEAMTKEEMGEVVQEAVAAEVGEVKKSMKALEAKLDAVLTRLGANGAAPVSGA
jgi:hypothetical protein